MKLVTAASRMPAPAATVSPILALGRRLQTVVERIQELDPKIVQLPDGVERRTFETAAAVASQEVNDIQMAISHLEAESIQDAAVQIRLISELAERIESAGDDDQDRAEKQVLAKAIHRISYSISAALNRATGFNPTDFGAEYYFPEKLNPHRAASLEAVPAVAAE